MISESMVAVKSPGAAGSVDAGKGAAGDPVVRARAASEAYQAGITRQLDELSEPFREALDAWRLKSTDPEQQTLDAWLNRQIASLERELKSVIKYRAMRRSQAPEELARRVEDEARMLGQRLFPRSTGVAGLSDLAEILQPGDRDSALAAGEEAAQIGPAWLVNRLESSAAGCQWLAAQLRGRSARSQAARNVEAGDDIRADPAHGQAATQRARDSGNRGAASGEPRAGSRALEFFHATARAAKPRGCAPARRVGEGARAFDLSALRRGGSAGEGSLIRLIGRSPG